MTTTIQHYSTATAKTGWLYHSLRTPQYLRTLVECRSLLWNFARRELLGRFRGSAFGILWVLIQPIFLFVVYFGIFGVLFADPRAIATEGPDVEFAFYLFSGILAFTALSEGSSTSLSTIVGNANLVKKVRFPCELLPLVPVLVAVAVYVVATLVMFVAGLIAGPVHVGPKLFAWPLLIVIMVVMTAGIGLFLSAADVFVRDISHLFRIVTTAWFFTTPNFWNLEMLQTQLGAVGLGWLASLLMWNPAFPLVLAQRQVFGIGDNYSAEQYAATFPWSLTTNLLVGAAWALFFLFVGYGFFKSRRHKFADLV